MRLVRVATGIRVKNNAPFLRSVLNKTGLEIGGPSANFTDAGMLPLYKHIRSLDNCIFSTQTVWSSHEKTYRFHPRKHVGITHVSEATCLKGISDDSYDFVLSASNLEHVANPIMALKKWMRVTRVGGSIILVLPYYKKTFDHRRTPTPVAHMVKDYENGIDERDTTHLDEVLRLHDLKRDKRAGTYEQFHQRCLNNFENRCIHHHVFDEKNSRELLATVGLNVSVVETVFPHYLVLLAHNPPSSKLSPQCNETSPQPYSAQSP